MNGKVIHVHVLETPGPGALVDRHQWKMMGTRCICTGKKGGMILDLLEVLAWVAPEFREGDGVIRHHKPVSSALNSWSHQ